MSYRKTIYNVFCTKCFIQLKLSKKLLPTYRDNAFELFAEKTLMFINHESKNE